MEHDERAHPLQGNRTDTVTQEVADYREALKIAEELIEAGIPVFAAPPNPEKPGHYYLPKEWEKTVPSRTWLDKWQPGWALAAVGGIRADGAGADFLDIDPRNGGRESEKELRLQRQFPRSFGQQTTPSGGTHHLLAPTGERKATGFMPGLDLQSGEAEPVNGSHGRGFVYIAPTMRPSKAPETLGEIRAYRWITPPDLGMLAEFSGADDSQDGLIARIHAKRSTETARPERTVERSAIEDRLFGSGWPAGQREFTVAEAETFCTPALDALEHAQIGEIEECANRAAVTLAHFVPAIWTVEQAYAILSAALALTAYDPAHPASQWTAEKFLPVLDGRRPPLDGWKALRKVTPEEVAAAFGQRESAPAELPHTPEEADAAVDALLAEMLGADEIAAAPPPAPLIKGLLNLDSLAWIIGAPGSKKSFVVLDMAARVARGMPWQGLRTHQGSVVMIVAEGAGGMSSRVQAWQKTHGPIGGREVFRALPRPVQARDLVAWQVLVEACRRVKPVLVVIDTQARVTVGLEENSATDMGVFVEAAERIRQATGACVAIVHHTGRNGGDARGSSALDGAQTTELKVVRQDATTGVLKIEKQKDMDQRPEMPLCFQRVVTGLDEDGDEISSLVLLEQDAARKVYADAAGQVKAPEEWLTKRPEVQEQILTVLVDQGGEIGLTKAETRANVTGRWYDRHVNRKGDARPGEHVLVRTTFDTAWTGVLSARTSGGDPVAVNVSGEKWIVDPDARKAWREAHPETDKQDA